MKTKVTNTLLPFTVAIACLAPLISSAQNNPIISERIAVIARSCPDSITLRWAPLDAQLWQWGNEHGYTVERYTLVRDGSLLPQAEKATLATSIKPASESHWEALVRDSKFAAIAAQALFGERFEINLKEADPFTIANKVRETEQRFLFALFSADMSAPVARLSALMFTDREVEKGEKYLYRIVIHSMDSLRGSTFISPDHPHVLPRPQNLRAEFKDRVVSLRWDKNLTRHYTAYNLERSKDGKNFVTVSDLPIVTASPLETEETRYEYAMDSLDDISTVHHYRVRGLTPFGEAGPPSAVISGRRQLSVNEVPYISSALSKDNKSVIIQWQFGESVNNAIKGFTVERSLNSKGTFKRLTKELLSSEIRIFEDDHPLQSNYYRVSAYGLDNARYHSPVYFVSLVDSLPPSTPHGLEAEADNDGVLRLSWTPNSEPDIYGYRIYKAYHTSEELAQITEGPVRDTTFTDRVDLNTLNDTVYYSIMALDINQNHSELSELLSVPLPDKVAPQPPLIVHVSDSVAGVSLRWIRGGSEDIVQYVLYRRCQECEEWNAIKRCNADSRSGYSYLDETALPGLVYHYTLVAVDDAGLESAPAPPVTGSCTDRGVRPAITWKKPRVNRELSQITVLWDYYQSQVQSFKIFRAVDDNPPVLFQTLSGEERQFTHTMIPGQYYRYRVMAVFEDGKKSSLSNEIHYQY